VKRSRFPLAVTWLLLAFFYLPIAVVVVNSFNGARFGGGFEGPTLDWYRRLFEHREIWPAVVNSLVIAVGATVVSVVLGTTAAIALHRYHGKLQRLHYGLIYTPLVVPEILMGISLLLFFAAVGLELGLFSIVLAHVTFCLSYVAMVVLGRLQDFDDSVVEAALDLGASWWTITWRILLPARPGHPGRWLRLHPLHRRLRDLVLRRRPRQHDAADPHLQHDQARGAAAQRSPRCCCW
jgi:spermidine/putrescine transport system permease protein